MKNGKYLLREANFLCGGDYYFEVYIKVIQTESDEFVSITFPDKSVKVVSPSFFTANFEFIKIKEDNETNEVTSSVPINYIYNYHINNPDIDCNVIYKHKELGHVVLVDETKPIMPITKGVVNMRNVIFKLSGCFYVMSALEFAETYEKQINGI